MKYYYLSLFIFFGGCMVGPNYTAPENNVADRWATTEEKEVIADSCTPPITEWWKIFDDPLLTKYIEMAAIHNQDVLLAESNILQARAMKQVTASALFPQIGVDVNATKTYFSKNGPIFAVGPSTGSLPGTISPTSGLPFAIQTPQIQNLFNALFDASWEIDLFGKTRRGVEAAVATIGSAIEQKNNILISVMAELARNFMETRSYQKRLTLTEKNIHLLEQKAIIIQKQLESGYVSKLEYENIEATLATARASLPEVKAEIYRSIFTISVLTGQVPETLLEELLTPEPLPKTPPRITIGLRSDLLLRRPDIRNAERQLAAATANIGVAVASFFPSISLIGDGGFQSLSIRNLFTAASKTWAIAGDVTMPIFQGGALVGNLKANRAAAATAAHMYQKTVLQALQETESALTSYSEDLISSRELCETVERNRVLVDLTSERHSKGLVSLLNLLDSEKQLVSAELTYLDRETATLVDLITLYKALGGGWEEKTYCMETR